MFHISGLQALTAVDEVWASSNSDLHRFVAAGVPPFMVHTISLGGRGSLGPFLARTDGLMAHNFRANGPAIIRHRRGGELWTRMKIPSRASITTHGVNGRLAAFW